MQLRPMALRKIRPENICMEGLLPKNQVRILKNGRLTWSGHRRSLTILRINQYDFEVSEVENATSP